MLTDPLHAGFGYACNRAPEPTAVISLGAGSYYTIDGKDQLAFTIHAIGQSYLGVIDDTGAHLYERIEHDNPKINPSDPEDMTAAIDDGRMSAFRAPEPGEHVVTVPTGELERVIGLGKELNVPAALDLLLALIKEDPGLTYASVHETWTDEASGENRLKLVVLGETDVYLAAFWEEGAVLQLKGALVSKATRQEIDAHAAYIETA